MDVVALNVLPAHCGVLLPAAALRGRHIFLAIIALVLYFGVRISTRVQLALALISIIVVTVFFISVIVKLGPANSFKPFPAIVFRRWLARDFLRRAVRDPALHRLRVRREPGRRDPQAA